MDRSTGIVLGFFFAVVFCVVVPFLKSRGSVGYIVQDAYDGRFDNRPMYVDRQNAGRYYDRRNRRRLSDRGGCATVGIVLAIAAVMFVVLVIRYSIMVEAGPW